MAFCSGHRFEQNREARKDRASIQPGTICRRKHPLKHREEAMEAVKVEQQNESRMGRRGPNTLGQQGEVIGPLAGIRF